MLTWSSHLASQTWLHTKMELKIMYSAGFPPQIFPSLSRRQLHLLSSEIEDRRRLSRAALEVQDEKPSHLTAGHLGLQQPLKEQSIVPGFARLGSRKTGRKQRSTHDIGSGSAQVSGGQTAGVRVQQAKGMPARPPNIWDEQIWRASQALGKCELGLFRKKRTEAKVAGARERGKWLETRSGRWRGETGFRFTQLLKTRLMWASELYAYLADINWPARCLEQIPCSAL